MKCTCTLSTLVKVLAAAFIVIAPMASRASDYTFDSPEEFIADSRSNSPQCPLGQSTLLTGCATTGMDQATKTTKLMQTVEGDYKQAFEQIDATSAFWEDLNKIGPDRYEEGL
jgi:hypothetical protein